MASQSVYDRENGVMTSELGVAAADWAKPVVELSLPSNRSDDLAREVYGVLGIPIDAVDMETVLREIAAAAAWSAPFLISTANLNFLATSLNDREFRESLLISDLCSADGVPVVWAARMLGVPMRGRVAGSDMFAALRAAKRAPPLKVFLFGGGPDIAAEASKRINAERGGLECVGTFYPGFCSVDEMSTGEVIDILNASDAEFVAVALGANKGQAWLRHNHARLKVPVRAHLGATINFAAGTIRRAPRFFQRLGLEWLWRIIEEPQIWHRYWNDGLTFVRLTATRILPLLVLQRWHAAHYGAGDRTLSVGHSEDDKTVFLSPIGFATAQNIDAAISAFRAALAANKDVVINFDATELIDARFLGLLLMLNKRLKEEGFNLTLAKVSSRIERLFRLNEFGFLLHHESKA